MLLEWWITPHENTRSKLAFSNGSCSASAWRTSASRPNASSRRRVVSTAQSVRSIPVTARSALSEHLRRDPAPDPDVEHILAAERVEVDEERERLPARVGGQPHVARVEDAAVDLAEVLLRVLLVRDRIVDVVRHRVAVPPVADVLLRGHRVHLGGDALGPRLRRGLRLEAEELVVDRLDRTRVANAGRSVPARARARPRRGARAARAPRSAHAERRAIRSGRASSSRNPVRPGQQDPGAVARAGRDDGLPVRRGLEHRAARARRPGSGTSRRRARCRSRRCRR